MPVSREAWVAAWAEDNVGELIKPLPIGWRGWRAEREVLYNQRQLGYADGIERAGIIGKYLLEHPVRDVRTTYIQAGYRSSGTEDYFLQSLYGAGINAMSSGPGDFGTTFCNTTPLSGSSVTRSMYRYHVDDPITFDTSLVMTWQAGDTSQKAWRSGSPKIWVTVYFYTEG